MNKIKILAIVAMPLAFTACSDDQTLDLDIDSNKYSNYPEDYFTEANSAPYIRFHQALSSNRLLPLNSRDYHRLSLSVNISLKDLSRRMRNHSQDSVRSTSAAHACTATSATATANDS